MPRVVRRLVALSGIAVVTSAVSGCGGEAEHPSIAPLAQIAVSTHPSDAPNGIGSIPPSDALERSIEALEAAGSYRVSGTTISGSAIDISFAVGQGSTGTVTSESAMQLVSVDGAVYVSGDPAGLSAQLGADVDTTIAGKWLLLSPDSTSGFAIFSDSATFAEAVLGAESPSDMTNITDVDGQPAIGLMFPESGGTLWVAAAGEPLPLRYEEKGASAGTGVLSFTDVGADVQIVAPAAESVVDTAKLPTATPVPTETPTTEPPAGEVPDEHGSDVEPLAEDEPTADDEAPTETPVPEPTGAPPPTDEPTADTEEIPGDEPESDGGPPAELPTPSSPER